MILIGPIIIALGVGMLVGAWLENRRVLRILDSKEFREGLERRFRELLAGKGGELP